MHRVRALLLRPAALGAIVGMAFLGIGMIFTGFAVRAAITSATTSASTICSAPPASSVVLTSQQLAGTPSDSASPGDSVSPSDSASPTDTNSASASSTDTTSSSGSSTDPTSSSGSDPGASASTSPSTSPSPTASPTPSPTPSPPTAQLCVLVKTYPTGATTVAAGDTASFIVWVWSTGATSTNVSVLASIGTASYLSAPSYAICPSASGATCTIASIQVGQVYELLASVPVSASAPSAAQVAFSAHASATVGLPFTATATETVAAASAAALPASTTTTVVPPLVDLPAIPGTSVEPVNPSALFPTVNPSPGTGKLKLPGAKSRSAVHVAAVSSTVPIDARLIGAQIIGLAVLAGAVTIAIVRMSLRRQVPVPAPPADAVQD
jgi:hypothetical protein